MEELDLLKKDWKRKENSFSQLSEKELYGMLHRKSSSIVKWILIISILELCLWTGIGFLFTDDYVDKVNHSEMAFWLKVLNYFNYAVVLAFIYLFYKNYVNISTTPCLTQTRPGVEVNNNPKLQQPLLNMEISAYPNPSQNYFNVKVNSPVKETVEIRMYDNLGKMVEIRRGAPDQVYRFGEGVAAGLYIIEARQNGMKDKATIRVVKAN